MAKFFLRTFLLLIAFSLNCMAAVNEIRWQLINSLESSYNPCAHIQNGQFVCLNCETLAYCIHEGGDWITIEYATCATDRSMYCNENTKSCSLQRECLIPSRGVKFECQNPGIYPDPYDCKTYHVCSNSNEDERIVCRNGLIYAAAERACVQNSADNDVCRQAQYQCDRPGMLGSWPDDANIYYICHVKRVDGELNYYPLMYRCEAGKIFDGKKCVYSNSTSYPQPSTTINGADSVDDCVNNRLVPHPTDCRSYFRCINGKMISEQCSPNTYFNANNSNCVFGSC